MTVLESTGSSDLRDALSLALGMNWASRQAYLGQRAPQYFRVLLVAFRVVIVGAGVAAVVRRRKRSEPVSLLDEIAGWAEVLADAFHRVLSCQATDVDVTFCSLVHLHEGVPGADH